MSLNGQVDLDGLAAISEAITKVNQKFAVALTQFGAALQEVSKMALKIKSKPAQATTSKTLLEKGTPVSEDVSQEPVEVPGNAPTAEQLCEVGVEMSYTHNLGNYTSARVQVSLRVPCEHAEIDSAYDYSREWCDNKLNGLIEELQAD